MGVLAIFLAAIVIGSIMNGWALSVLWTWFIVPIFKWPILSIAQAVGLGMVVSFLTRHSINTDDTSKDMTDAVGAVIANSAIYPVLVVGIGWIVTVFL